jgi:uncharacterized protein (TIGR03083 family)
VDDDATDDGENGVTTNTGHDTVDADQRLARSLAAIAEHSAALADAAQGNLDAQVEHCPGWSVYDLVNHVRQVQWFWASIATGRLQQPPAFENAPAQPSRETVIDELRIQTEVLVGALGAADQSAPVWTWSSQQDVAFITRHQVQEAAVHRWDAEHAAGRSVEFDPVLAADAVEEFLTFCLRVVPPSSDAAGGAGHDEPGAGPLGGPIVLAASDVSVSWTVDDEASGLGVRVIRGAHGDGAATLEATASQLLLWLYRRVELTASGAQAETRAARLRSLGPGA